MSDVLVQDTVVAAPPTAGLADVIHERVVVAPAAGRFRVLPPEQFTSEGEWVEPGQVVADVERGDGVVPVRCGFRGWVMGALAMDVQPVEEGQALLWIREP